MAGRKVKVDPWLTPEGLDLLRAYARRGMTDEQIANAVGISRSTLDRWKHAHASIRDTLRASKDIADAHVENALYKRACGYESTEVTRYRDPKTGEMYIGKEVTKQVAPDVTAAVFWLKNRARDRWSDRPERSETAEDRVGDFMAALTGTLQQSAAAPAQDDDAPVGDIRVTGFAQDDGTDLQDGDSDGAN